MSTFHLSLLGQGVPQVGELLLALVLGMAIGLEREIRQKSAGLRTHTLVAVGAALFMLVSKYGFFDVLETQRIVLDPSRVAAQIVSGIGFLGAGLIFVRRDLARGLTTAAAIWFTAAVGSAAGAGLWLLAVLAVATYFLVVVVFPRLVRVLPRSSYAISEVRIRYPDGQGRLRELLEEATDQGFAIDRLSRSEPLRAKKGDRPTVEVSLQVHGKRSAQELAAALSAAGDVEAVVGADDDTGDD